MLPACSHFLFSASRKIARLASVTPILSFLHLLPPTNTFNQPPNPHTPNSEKMALSQPYTAEAIIRITVVAPNGHCDGIELALRGAEFPAQGRILCVASLRNEGWCSALLDSNRRIEETGPEAILLAFAKALQHVTNALSYSDDPVLVQAHMIIIERELNARSSRVVPRSYEELVSGERSHALLVFQRDGLIRKAERSQLLQELSGIQSTDTRTNYDVTAITTSILEAQNMLLRPGT